MSDQKSVAGCLGFFIGVFFVLFFGITGVIIWNIANVGSAASNAIEKICSGQTQQDIVVFTSKYTNEDSYLMANTSDRRVAQIIGHPCDWKPEAEVLRSIYFDATDTYGAIEVNQPSYVEYVSVELYGQDIIMVSAVKLLTPSQAFMLKGLLEQGRVDEATLAEVLAQ